MSLLNAVRFVWKDINIYISIVVYNLNIVNVSYPVCIIHHPSNLGYFYVFRYQVFNGNI